MRHSGLGIAAFVLSLVGFVGMFLTFAVAGAMRASGVPTGERDPASILVGLAVIVMGLVSLLAVGLGLGGLFQKGRRKLFAWLGFGVAVFTVLSTAGLIILGMSRS
ncbi:MAG TPA: hypothetical protein VFR91_03535 [Dyella sp.]|nr:hypothetical protein [Dyella sp.]